MSSITRLAEKSSTAGIALAPPLSSQSVVKFEDAFGLKIPVDYRAFLLNVANGGLHPCRLLPLHYWSNSYWIDNPEPSMVGRPCRITPDSYLHGESWLNQMDISDWESLWGQGEWDPMFGTIAIAEIGCGLHYSLIMNGPYQGRIFSWGDHALIPPRMCEELSFTEWFENLLDEVISGQPVHFLNGRIQ